MGRSRKLKVVEVRRGNEGAKSESQEVQRLVTVNRLRVYST